MRVAGRGWLAPAGRMVETLMRSILSYDRARRFRTPLYAAHRGSDLALTSTLKGGLVMKTRNPILLGAAGALLAATLYAAPAQPTPDSTIPTNGTDTTMNGTAGTATTSST